MGTFQKARSNTYRCSFCNKSQEQVERLIAGPNHVYICDECVALCQEIIEEGRRLQHAPQNAPTEQEHE